MKIAPHASRSWGLVSAEIGAKYSGTRCKDIAGDLVGTPEVKQICGGIILQTYKKVNEILASNNF